jgi:hypothetical protein
METTLSVKLPSGEKIDAKGISHENWDSMQEPCPDCGGEEFSQMDYGAGRYGIKNGTPILRNDYWDRNGTLRVKCLKCNTILFQHPAYALLKQLEVDEFAEG